MIMLGSLRKHGGLIDVLIPVITVLICFIITLAIEGITLSDLTVPSGENDELIYYYEVEGVLHHGIPQGYFGSTEITARVMSFGAWSPLLILNFTVLGKLFGWSALRAVIYNLTMLMCAVFFFGLLARPSRRQAVILSVCISLYTLFMYHVLSVTPEITCYFYSIIYIGLCYSSFRDNKAYKRVLMFIIAILLTLMRPYYAGLFVPAAFFMYKKHGKKSLALTLPVTLITFYAYFFIAINLCAASPIGGSFSKYIRKVGYSKGYPFLCSDLTGSVLLLAGSFFTRLINGIKAIVVELRRFFIDGIWGRNYFMFFLILLLFAILWLRRRKSEAKEKNLWRLFWIGYFIMMTLAVALYFSGWVADRHLAEFVVMGMFVMVMETGDDWNTNVLLILLEAGLIYSVLVVPNLPRHYLDEAARQEIEDASGRLAMSMPLKEEGSPSWDNTILWVYSDRVEGEEAIIPWQPLFAVPSGYGFNLVYNDKWLDDHYPLFSKYIAAVPGSDTEKRCIKWGADKLDEYGGVVIYRLR